jgi:hypothetical protein
MAVLAGIVLFTSCENMFDNIIDKLTGNADAIVGRSGGGDALEQEFTSSIVMFDKEANPQYAVGLSMTMDIEDLLSIDDVEDIQFPFLVYRVVCDNIKSGSSFTVENALTEADLKDFDYQDLISGDFSENNLVGIAVSPTKFYIMKSGTVSLSKVNKTKMVGSFTGEAYLINLDAEPMLEPELVPMSGNFTSRITDLMKWLIKIQEKKGE